MKTIVSIIVKKCWFLNTGAALPGTINYQFSPLDNISFRPEFYDDKVGQRTGTKTRYLNFGLGWQHWLSPQIELRPEVDYDYALDKDAFNGNANAGIAPDKRYTLLGAIDIIMHF